jgi:hypothetical protein
MGQLASFGPTLTPFSLKGIAAAFAVPVAAVSFLNGSVPGLEDGGRRRLTDTTVLFQIISEVDATGASTPLDFSQIIMNHVVNAGNAISTTHVDGSVFEVVSYNTHIEYNVYVNMTLADGIAFAAILREHTREYESMPGVRATTSVQLGDAQNMVKTTDLNVLCTMGVYGLDIICSARVELDDYPSTCSAECAPLWVPVFDLCAGWVAPMFGEEARVFDAQCQAEVVGRYPMGGDDALCYLGYVSTSAMPPGRDRCAETNFLIDPDGTCLHYFEHGAHKDDIIHLFETCDYDPGEEETEEGDEGNGLSVSEAELRALCVTAVDGVQPACCPGAQCVRTNDYPSECGPGCAADWTAIFEACSHLTTDGYPLNDAGFEESIFGTAAYFFEAECKATVPEDAPVDVVSSLCGAALQSDRLCEFAAVLVQPGAACAADAFFVAAVRDACRLGCTLAAAENYDPRALIDDNSCMHEACLSVPCLYGGTCTETGRDYVCACTPGHTGDRCEAVMPRYAFAPECSIVGPGTHGAMVNSRASFAIVTFDQFGEPLVSDVTETFIAMLTAADGADVHMAVTHAGANVFDVEYVLPAFGEYQLSITTVWGEDLVGSPTTVRGVTGPSSVHLEFCAGRGFGLSNAIAGVQTSFTVDLYDKFGLRPSVTKSRLRAEISSADGSGSSFDTTIDTVVVGEFRANYYPDTSGVYNVTILVDNVAIPASPYTVLVAGGPPTTSATTVVGVVVSEVGTEATFLIVPRDKHGNINSEGSAQYSAYLASNFASQVACKIVVLANGTYQGSYVPLVRPLHPFHLVNAVRV